MLSSEVGGQEPSNVVTQGPWISRDGFVAETAVKLEKMLSRVEELEREHGVVRAHVTQLTDHADDVVRLQSFAETLRNARESKIAAIERTASELKARLDQVQGPRDAYLDLNYASLNAIDERLKDLKDLEKRFVRVERMMSVSVTMFVGAALMLVGTMGWTFMG